MPQAACEGWNDGGVSTETVEREGAGEGERNGLWYCQTAIKAEEGCFGFLFLYSSHLAKQIGFP